MAELAELEDAAELVKCSEQVVHTRMAELAELEDAAELALQEVGQMVSQEAVTVIPVLAAQTVELDLMDHTVPVAVVLVGVLEVEDVPKPPFDKRIVLVTPS
jgi:hypothetical protein